jgi:hypothetical protein
MGRHGRNAAALRKESVYTDHEYSEWEWAPPLTQLHTHTVKKGALCFSGASLNIDLEINGQHLL